MVKEKLTMLFLFLLNATLVCLYSVSYFILANIDSAMITASYFIAYTRWLAVPHYVLN